MPKVTIKNLELPELMTISQVAELLQVHRNTLRQWDERGILKAVRLGERGDRRYNKQDIIDFVSKQKAK